jgi:hypothetical protein
MAKNKPKQRQRQFDVALVFGDLHVPYHHEGYFKMLLDAIRYIRPQVLILNGDGIDMYQISRFGKDPKRKLELNEDRWQFVECLNRINKVAPRGCAKHYLAGNHEARLARFLHDKAPELAYLDELDTAEFLKTRQSGWEYHPNSEKQLPVMYLGHLAITHGYIARKHSGYTARAMVEDRGESVLVNHSHRLGSSWKTDCVTTHVAYENGHLFDVQRATYVSGAKNWQVGFSIVTIEDATGFFRVEQIPIVKIPDLPKNRMMLHEGVFECHI